MQLHVDTDTESVAGLMLLSRLLIDYANMKAQHDKALEGSHQPDPAVIFGKFPVPTGASPSNVVPLFPQPALNLPGATCPAVLGAPPVLAAAPGVTAITGTQTAPSLPANNAAVSSAGVDIQGIPWDERIHSSSKKVKGDGTWILKRGADHALAKTITAQLIAAKLPIANAGVTQAAAVGQMGAGVTPPAPVVPVAPVNATVPLPPGLQTSAVPVPPFTDSAPSSAPVFVPVAQPVPGVPIPPTPAAGAVPVPEINPVKRFGAMMAKVSQALGAKTITQQQVLDAHVAVGLQQLQQAVLNPDKIPLIEAALGLA